MGIVLYAGNDSTQDVDFNIDQSVINLALSECRNQLDDIIKYEDQSREKGRATLKKINAHKVLEDFNQMVEKNGIPFVSPY